MPTPQALERRTLEEAEAFPGTTHVDEGLRLVWVAAGLGLTGLAILGALLPVMPSTVFAIGAAGCFSRSSPKLERWLLTHPRLGPTVLAWRAERAIPFKAKVVALSSMAASGALMVFTAPPRVSGVAVVVLLASALYVGTRPEPAKR
ncbi:MAG: YbaN family protein [Alphaproteobacteria bacterium]|nr:YbaN family protein [Alphaproteobacteria bacterium]